MKSIKNLVALALALPAAYVAIASPAHAAVTSATIDAQTATLNLDGADDNVTVSVANGLLVHGQTTGGLNSGADWNSAMGGDQTVPANGTFGVVVNGNGGNDAITVVAKATEVSGVRLSGGLGDDVLTGANSNDSLSGGEGNDRLVGGPGDDTISGDAGNDTMVWNNGDNTDTNDGGAGNDTTEVNGSQTAGDVFTMAPDQNAGQVRFQRTNLIAFTIHSTAENFRVNGLGGNDSLATTDGVGARTLLSVDGGTGTDTINGSDGPDLIAGGEDNDVLNGGGGDDRIVGDRGSDTMNGGTGDDTLVWNNGDGTDVMNGDAGRDDIEVNGSPTAGDVFTVKPNGSRITFNRSNLVPFTLDIGSSETLHANGLGGEDSITDSDVGAFQVTASGGPGNDTITGGASSETLLGGSGNDTITGGGGIDVVSGDDGNDQVNVRDRTADIALGGAGTDSAIADTPNLDILDGFESVDRNEAGVPPVTPGHGNGVRAATIGGGTVKVNRSKHTAAIKVSCPAGSAGHCTGSVTVSTAGSVHLAGLRARLQLGSARYDLAPGASKRVKVKLARGVERLADRKGHVKVRVVATTGASGMAASTSRRLTLSIPR